MTQVPYATEVEIGASLPTTPPVWLELLAAPGRRKDRQGQHGHAKLAPRCVAD
jgi:hypothetical protein